MEKHKNNLNQVKEMEEKHTKEILGENKVFVFYFNNVEKFEDKNSFLNKYCLICQTKCVILKTIKDVNKVFKCCFKTNL